MIEVLATLLSGLLIISSIIYGAACVVQIFILIVEKDTFCELYVYNLLLFPGWIIGVALKLIINSILYHFVDWISDILGKRIK